VPIIKQASELLGLCLQTVCLLENLCFVDSIHSLEQFGKEQLKFIKLILILWGFISDINKVLLRDTKQCIVFKVFD
jgi:hypothetical protein